MKCLRITIKIEKETDEEVSINNKQFTSALDALIWLAGKTGWEINYKPKQKDK